MFCEKLFADEKESLHTFQASEDALKEQLMLQESGWAPEPRQQVVCDRKSGLTTGRESPDSHEACEMPININQMDTQLDYWDDVQKAWMRFDYSFQIGDIAVKLWQVAPEGLGKDSCEKMWQEVGESDS